MKLLSRIRGSQLKIVDQEKSVDFIVTIDVSRSELYRCNMAVHDFARIACVNRGYQALLFGCGASNGATFVHVYKEVTFTLTD